MSVRSIAGKLALAVLAPVVTLALIEGLSSLALSGWSGARWRDQPMPEGQHSRYDPELGWVSLPNVDSPNHYGAGRDLHTNSRGFRGRAETVDPIPSGQHRVICSGDSFTLGWGVADDDAWCAVLGKAFPGLETVNMGQGGYGVDQAYLWYRRDGMSLEHDLHIFAYTVMDFERMLHRRFEGYGKPVLALQGDSLVVTNVPAPQRGAAWRMGERVTTAVRATRLAEFMNRLVKTRASSASETAARDSAAFDVAAAVVRQLAAIHRRRASTLILVHLPVQGDYYMTTSDVFLRRMSVVAAAEGVSFVDLVAPFRAMPRDSVNGQFLLGDSHYASAGNRWVARQLEPFIRSSIAARTRR